ncbi:MAG: 2,3-bisphosphoglycerate-independent phosphoglycerate mutase [Chloroflexi bacterium 44-23]|nr:MAG: 2,3-bisphosphoglycerate-independent phosphoglycerate mutase [Chloroflexi bacterium 44-23]
MVITEKGIGGQELAKAVQAAYQLGESDYSLNPLVYSPDGGEAQGRIQKGDSVIFCCRRGEREIELTEAFTDSSFNQFNRFYLQDLNFVILTLYHEKFKDLPVAFAPLKVNATLAEIISKAGMKQLHCAESEKFAHVTFFFNGGNNNSFAGEVDERLPSPRGIPFEQVPELNLEAVTEKVNEGIRKGFDFIVTNFANGDVIGHTTNKAAKIACAAYVDHGLGKVLETALMNDYVVLVTADHGNLEVLYSDDGQAHVAHTTNTVPLFLLDALDESSLDALEGKLADIAPTILSLLGLKTPPEMTGRMMIHSKGQAHARKVLLIILDGWGNGSQDETNPIFLAKTPIWDNLNNEHVAAVMHASGQAVGLKAGKAGNSEAGHMNIGAGRVVLQDDVRLDLAMQDGSFFTNQVILDSFAHVQKNHSHLHLIALLTEKSSHGSIDYPLAILKMAKLAGIGEVFVHIIFDGRSTQPGSAPQLLLKFEDAIREIGIGKIVSGFGRGLALDRDGNYAKIEKVYNALVSGQGRQYGGIYE